MANLHLVTGHQGSAHISAADQGSLYAAILGAGNYVLARGKQFAVSVISNNQIRIADGDLMMQGRHVRLNEDTYTDLTIENGTQGYKRNDLIVCRYTLAQSTGEEECNLVVIKGEETTGTASDPEYSSGSILGGDTQVDFPLYRVPLSGLSVGTPVQLFSVLPGVLPLSGGTLTGALTVKGLYLTNGVDYFSTAPSSAPKGKLILVKV